MNEPPNGQARELGPVFLEIVRADFEKLKRLAEQAVAVLDDEQVHWTLGPDSNSIYILLKHMAGNLRSRWTAFLTADGEKPDRDRDGEFEDDQMDRASLLAGWEEGWSLLFGTLAGLRAEDLLETVYIKGEPHSVAQALTRQLTHHAYHVGQIVFLAKHMRGGDWETLSIPRRSAGAVPRTVG